MPNCNLVESIDNKWLQASDNKGGIFYVAIMDNYIQAFIQNMAYHQFLESGVWGDGPSKEERKLWRAQHSDDPIVQLKVLLDLEGGDDLYICSPHFKGVEVFGSEKCNPDTPIRAEKMHHVYSPIPLLFPWTFMEWTFPPTQIFIFFPNSPSLWDTINKTNADGCICTSYGPDYFEGHHDSTPLIWLRDHVVI